MLGALDLTSSGYPTSFKWMLYRAASEDRRLKIFPSYHDHVPWLLLNQKQFLAVHFPTYYLHVPNNLKTKWQTCYKMMFATFQLYSVELSGPLLPGCLFEMCQLLKTSQKGTFKATFSTHQPSVAFNVPSGHTKSESEEFFSCGSDLEEGISSGQWKHYQESEQLSGSCLKELTCSEGLYTWLT